MKPVLWFVPPVLVFTGILLLSTVLSVSIQIEGVDFTDKLAHLFAYFALVITSLLALYKNGSLHAVAWVSLIFACSSYGVLLEFVQYSLFPNRFFEWLDALANVTGVFTGALIFALFNRSRISD